MTQTSNRLFDEMARLMTDAASVAQGVRREAETVLRTQVERWIADLDLVKREDFDVVREIASKARAENERLAERVAVLEARLGIAGEAPETAAGSTAPAKPESPPAEATGAVPSWRNQPILAVNKSFSVQGIVVPALFQAYILIPMEIRVGRLRPMRPSFVGKGSRIRPP